MTYAASILVSLGLLASLGAVPACGQQPQSAWAVPDSSYANTPPQGSPLPAAAPTQVGMDSATLAQVRPLLEQVVSSGAAPGAELLVMRHGQVVTWETVGYHTYDSLRPISQASVFDLASITKVASTTSVAMWLHSQGLLDLTAPVSQYVPSLAGTDKADILVEDLLLHQAGLTPWIPFYRYTQQAAGQPNPLWYQPTRSEAFPHFVAKDMWLTAAARDSLWLQMVRSERLEKAGAYYPYKYSDLSMYLMQAVVESVGGKPLDSLAHQHIFQPLGLEHIGFRPLQWTDSLNVVPTEEDDYWRMGPVQGRVHDMGAAMYGEVAGHAGLFSDAASLARLMHVYLHPARADSLLGIDSATLLLFTQPYRHGNRRGLGWNKPLLNGKGGPTCAEASLRTFGHTGFTGTAVWADPAFDLVFVFLSNRTYPDMENGLLIEKNFRTRLQSLYYQAMAAYEANLRLD